MLLLVFLFLLLLWLLVGVVVVVVLAAVAAAAGASPAAVVVVELVCNCHSRLFLPGQVLRRNVEELKRQHAAQLEKQRLLERDFAHLKAALKQRELGSGFEKAFIVSFFRTCFRLRFGKHLTRKVEEQAGRSLQTALTEQKRLVRVATAEEARFQAASDDASEPFGWSCK